MAESGARTRAAQGSLPPCQGIRETPSRRWIRATTAQTGHLSVRCRLCRATLTNSRRLNTQTRPPPAESRCWPRPPVLLPRRPRLSPGTRRLLGSPSPWQSLPTLTPLTLPTCPPLLPTDCHRPRGRRRRLPGPRTSPRLPLPLPLPPPHPRRPSSRPRPSPRPPLRWNPPLIRTSLQLPRQPFRLSVLPLWCRHPPAWRQIRRCLTASTGC